MKPVKFEGHNAILAEDQPQYLPLPVLVVEDCTISCWKLSLWERIKVFFTGILWLEQLNFGQSLQPQRPSADIPFTLKEPNGSKDD